MTGLITAAQAANRGWTPAIVTIDGVDISRECVACDDRQGWAVVMRHEGQWRFAVTLLVGDVVFTRRAS